MCQSCCAASYRTHHIVQYGTEPYCSAPYCTVPHGTIPNHTVQYRTALRRSVHRIVRYPRRALVSWHSTIWSDAPWRAHRMPRHCVFSVASVALRDAHCRIAMPTATNFVSCCCKCWLPLQATGLDYSSSAEYTGIDKRHAPVAANVTFKSHQA
jgi:hypothetical protein